MSKIRYAELLRITLNHPYYEDGVSADLQLRPSAETERQLQNYRIIFKAQPNGGRLFIARDTQGNNVIPLPTLLQLDFHLVLNNKTFWQFTDQDAFEKGIPEWPADKQLNQVRISRLSTLPAEPNIIPIRIQLSATHGSQPPIATILFEPQSYIWQYHIVADGSHVNMDVTSPNGGVGFTRELGSSLVRNIPVGAQLWRFTSNTTKIACRQKPAHRYILHIGTRKVMLPWLDPNNAQIRGNATLNGIIYI